jgi:3-oxoacyl-[acyl-carrier protein] reductase
MDVTSSAMIEAALLAVTKSYGGVDILINAAGITIDKPMKKLTDKDWFDVLNVNLTGTFYTCRAVAPIMAARGGGSIVNVSSIVGIDGNACQANYAASKAGVIGLTKSLAKELAPKNIRVNAVAPGFINTSMTAKVPPEILKSYIDRTPLKRQGKPIEVAKAIKYLVADADYSTGDIIVVDGGLTIGV